MPEVAKNTVEVAGGTAADAGRAPHVQDRFTGLLRSGQSPKDGRSTLSGQRQHRGDREQAPTEILKGIAAIIRERGAGRKQTGPGRHRLRYRRCGTASAWTR